MKKTLIVLSDNIVLTDNNFLPIESGIEPDVLLEEGYTYVDVLDYINNN